MHCVDQVNLERHQFGRDLLHVRCVAAGVSEYKLDVAPRYETALRQLIHEGLPFGLLIGHWLERQHTDAQGPPLCRQRHRRG